MGKFRVKLPDGRTVDGEFRWIGAPVLIADGKPYSALDAVNQGLCVFPVNDPIIDSWLNTVSVGQRR